MFTARFTNASVKRILSDKTVRVVSALLFCSGLLLFFQYVPPALRWPFRLVGLCIALWLILVTLKAVREVRLDAKKIIFSLILGALLYAALSLVCHVFIKLMSARDERISMRVVSALDEEQRKGIRVMLDGTSYEMYDRDIGWVPRPGRGSDGATVSKQGLRSLREYAIPPPDPEKRILCLGDSFTYGAVVKDTETYPYYAEQLRPGTEWVNLGISGACLTQCLLHYRMNGKKFGGKHVVIGFMTDDAKRTVNCFRPFLTPFNPFTKPFAKYSNGVFSIEPNPYQDISDFKRLLANEGPEIERLLKLDYLSWSNQASTRNPILRTTEYVVEAMHLDRNFTVMLGRAPPKSSPKVEPSDDPHSQSIDPYGRSTWDPKTKRWTKKPVSGDPYGRAIWDPDSLGFIALTHVFDLLYNEIIADGRVPLIVIIPGPLDVENYTKQLPRLYESLTDHLKAKKYRYIDFLDPLVASHKGNLSTEALYFVRHFRAPINKELATEIIKALPVP